MIREAIDRILELSRPNILEANGSQYTDKTLNRIQEELRAEPLKFDTLSGMVQYIIKMKQERKEGAYILQVNDYNKVSFYSQLDGDRKRETLAIAEYVGPKFRFGSFYEAESFIIAMQSMFKDISETPKDGFEALTENAEGGNKDDRAVVMRFAGSVKSGTIKEYGDDGIGQAATIKMGISGMNVAQVPNPCELTPFRTFTEVEQPTSKFIFRAKDERGTGVEFALFEADGGAWKTEAMRNIKEYLVQNLLTTEDDILIVS